MFKPLSLFLGIRYVRSRHGQGFSSFISASSTLGIALGVMVLIIVLSAMNGFERELAKRLLSVVPHGEFITVLDPLDNWQEQINTIDDHPDVIAAAPVIKLNGMLQKGEKLKALEVRAVDPELERKVSDITQFIAKGQWLDDHGQTLVIGRGIASKLGVKPGDTVQLLLPREQGEQGLSTRFAAPMKKNMTIVGVFDFGGTIDDSMAFMPLATGAEFLNLGDKVHGIRISVSDVFQAPKVIAEIGHSLEIYVYMHDWTRTQGHLFNDIQLVRTVMFVVMLLLIAVASFNIVSSLIMAVNEKKGDIAILKTMGATPQTLMLAFIVQGLVNGILGCLLGGLAGVWLSQHLTAIIRQIEQWFGVNFLSGDIYFIDFLPTHLQASDVITTICAALLLSLLATLYPAWRATKVEPAQVLGHV
ncbi:lipoprotein-releasing ABC transporter permease subunit LolE [Thalassotalea mangrovi]|uniref:Lipoprotein-releasing ABC transporter permease subunit LolE n=1 Tax=Thalassotalea mangrovi TaxID=2572245 RepID=A0A4U1B381_9GAMM|nr:lipoprotein-releasing ABC transporter permease subunit LolE [Thalassotalea mangrovi]TKB44115.1 lipoprotein-releasing ABC transporter permease subunit LolE [Thalassotalea mangrovi]